MAYLPTSGTAFRQCDMLKNVRTFCLERFDDDGKPVGMLREYSYSVIVTQDCDLEQDFAARFPQSGKLGVPDKLLFGILLCGAYDEDLIRVGKHKVGAKTFGRKEWKPVLKNQDPRYQYLGQVLGTGKKFVVDFKDFFMVPCEFLYNQLSKGQIRRVTEMESPYKEHLLQRFAWYLMRVGLPKDFDQLPQS